MSVARRRLEHGSDARVVDVSADGSRAIAVVGSSVMIDVVHLHACLECW